MVQVAIDVRTVTQARSGVGNYVLNLLDGLRQEALEHEFFLGGRSTTWRYWAVSPHLRHRGRPSPKRAIPGVTSGSIWCCPGCFSARTCR